MKHRSHVPIRAGAYSFFKTSLLYGFLKDFLPSLDVIVFTRVRIPAAFLNGQSHGIFRL
jgi:hypothetical protein